MTRIILKYRRIIIILSVLIAAGGLLMMPRMKTDPDIRNYIPHNMESRINTDLIEEQFGVQDIIMIIFSDSMILTRDNLLRIEAVDREISRLSSIDRTTSLFSTRHIYSSDGAMIVDPAITSIPNGAEGTEELKNALSSNPLAIGMVVSADFTAASIIATMNSREPETDLLARIDTILAANPGKAEIHLGGLPFIRKGIMADVKRDGVILIPMALLIMLAFLWVAFREWKGMVLPFTIVAMSIAIAMGLAPLLGWKLSVISLIVPVMLIAVANDYGIHMIAKYQEISRENSSMSMKEISGEVVRKLRKPIFFTGLTTIAGVLGLLTHSVIPARHVGVLTAAGIAFAMILTLFMLPAWLSMLKPAAKVHSIKTHKVGFLDRLLKRTSSLVTTRPVRVLIVSAVLTLLFASGIFMIKVDSNQENFFPKKHPVKMAAKLINSKFGGSQSISVMATADIKDPKILKDFESWENELLMMEGVGDVFTISDVIKEMSKGLYESNEEGYNAIPGTRAAVAQLLEIYNMNGDPDDFEKLVDYDYTRAHILISMNDPETAAINRVLAKIGEMSSRDNVEVVTGGYAYIMSQFSDKIVRGQVSSMVFALVVVFILLSLIFRSVKGGLISVIPILASVVFLLGFMGLTGISLNPATALLSSIMIGVGVDYTIHFIWRYKAELSTLDPARAVSRTLATTGRGIVFNALSVMVGFSVLVFSGFTSIRFFGYLVLISIGVCLISALFVVPSLMIVFRPSFVEAQESEQTNLLTHLRFIMKRAVLIIAIIVFPASGNLESQTPLPVQSGKASEVMEKCRISTRVNAFEALSDLTITDSKGRTRERTNVTASKSYPDGTEKRIIKFVSPPDIEGTTVLIWDHEQGDDEMWIYLPALHKSRRIVSSEKGKSFMGSEFSNSDMASPPTADFTHRFIDAEAKPGLVVIESKPSGIEKEEEYGYSRKVSIVSLTNYTVISIDFFDLNGELFKRIEIPEYLEIVPGRFMIKHMTARNLISGATSEIVMREINGGSEVRDELFLVSNLGK